MVVLLESGIKDRQRFAIKASFGTGLNRRRLFGLASVSQIRGTISALSEFRSSLRNWDEPDAMLGVIGGNQSPTSFLESMSLAALCLGLAAG